MDLANEQTCIHVQNFYMKIISKGVSPQQVFDNRQFVQTPDQGCWVHPKTETMFRSVTKHVPLSALDLT